MSTPARWVARAGRFAGLVRSLPRPTPKTAQCLVSRWIDSAEPLPIPSWLPEVDDEVIVFFSVLDAASDLDAFLPDGTPTRLLAATIVHGAWEAPEFLEVVRQDPVMAAIALAAAAQALHTASSAGVDVRTDAGEHYAIPADSLFELAGDDRLAATALIARARLAIPDPIRDREVDGYRIVTAGEVAMSETYWGDASGHFDFHRPMPSRRAELDHVGAYNFMVEISGVEAGYFRDSGVSGVSTSAPIDGDDVVVLYRKRPGRALIDTEVWFDVELQKNPDGGDTLSFLGTGWGFPPTLLDRGEAGDNFEYYSARPSATVSLVLGIASHVTEAGFALDPTLAEALESDAFASGEAMTVRVPMESLLDAIPPAAAWQLVRDYPALALVVGGT